MVPKLVLFNSIFKKKDILNPLPEIMILNIWGGTWVFITHLGIF